MSRMRRFGYFVINASRGCRQGAFAVRSWCVAASWRWKCGASSPMVSTVVGQVIEIRSGPQPGPGPGPGQAHNIERGKRSSPGLARPPD
ncbi:Rho guanine nucleotide exchange factor 18 [Frankliniella fusca]|uniref:Rho guanine nucleotide exchange factor 18 n=1 Tax=Frankliniella fusca TaxID=407009 RepID=A0AAE1L9R8_9NEOP|nr:Rho guanine nucleotide exchange factor 18 [Frankliniella fusca]